MGLSTSCYVFTKMLRPFVRKWRGEGIKVIVYLDDGIISDSSEDETRKSSKIVKNDIDSSGLVINIEKSDLNPRQKGSSLGISIDTTTMKFSVPKEKLISLLQRIKTALSQELIVQNSYHTSQVIRLPCIWLSVQVQVY